MNAARNPLDNSPARLCDLKGDELRAALAERARRHKANWLRTRTREPWFRRAAARLRVIPVVVHMLGKGMGR
jgi:hypothetical protein